MASYEDLQSALVEFGNARESYWSMLEGHAKTVRDGLEQYFDKVGQTTEFNSEVVPYVALGEGTITNFSQIKSPSKLPADDTSLEFLIRVIIESPMNKHYKIGSAVAVEMSQENGQLNITLGEYSEKSQLTFPAEFNERHQTQLFDAIANMIISRLDVRKFA